MLTGTGLVVFALAWLAARRGQRWRLIGAGVVLALVIAKSVLTWMPVWEATCFPFAGYIYLQSFVMPIVMMAFFGIAAPQLAVPWNRVVVGLLALGFYLQLGFVGNWWMVSRPVIGTERTPDAAHHLRQSTPYTCAPSAAAMAVSYVGIAVSERTMADRCLTVPEGGTTRFNTYRGLILTLEGTPWRARMVHAEVADLCRQDQVTVIDFPDLRHAITTVGTGDGVTLHDPLQPRPLPLSREDLTERYGGVAILIERR
ncbi:MAG TPA: C39 family peptidase [Planctomycetota bacterium]|nr:C39 family peptidase [Planctomycetota bacterium]